MYRKRQRLSKSERSPFHMNLRSRHAADVSTQTSPQATVSSNVDFALSEIISQSDINHDHDQPANNDKESVINIEEYDDDDDETDSASLTNSTISINTEPETTKNQAIIVVDESLVILNFTNVVAVYDVCKETVPFKITKKIIREATVGKKKFKYLKKVKVEEETFKVNLEDTSDQVGLRIKNADQVMDLNQRAVKCTVVLSYQCIEMIAGGKLCLMQPSSYAELENHLLIVHGINHFRCFGCNQSFSQKLVP